ncbi:MAG: MFS transporter, partial [Deltaproteobacteria bacterium]|nr:MFS transporter [Deltaproteobacteria bacterium]
MFAVFRSRRMAVLFGLGFASGLPLTLTGQTLQAWATDAKVDLKAIAALSLVGIAYTLKFVWAPLTDRYRLPWLGRRRGWALLLQLLLAAAIAALATCDPREPARLAATAVVVALLSATQDTVLDAYNADVLAPEQRAAGSAVYVLGYRVAYLGGTMLALVLSDRIAWPVIYGGFAMLMLVGVVATLAAEEPPAPARPPRSLASAVIEPFTELARRLGARRTALVLAFAAVYELGYFFAQTLMIPFFRAQGFSNTDIAEVYKAVGLAGLAIGGLVAGDLVARAGLRRTLAAFAALAGATHLLYAALATVGHSWPMFVAAVLLDSIANAMVIAAFLAVLMSVTSAGVSATQLALLTSLSSVG